MKILNDVSVFLLVLFYYNTLLYQFYSKKSPLFYVDFFVDITNYFLLLLVMFLLIGQVFREYHKITKNPEKVLTFVFSCSIITKKFE